MSQLNHEIDPLSWETQSWANLCNDIPDNSAGNKEIHMPEMGEDKEKKRGREKKGKGKAKANGKNVEKKDEEASDHEIHIWTERERRKKMRNMFSSLHSLLPQLPPKADKTTIVDEAISYIKTLQTTFQRLQKQKMDRLKGGPSNCLTSVAATSRLGMLSTRESFMADKVASSINNNLVNPNNNSSGMAKTSTVFSASASRLPVAIQTWSSMNMVLNVFGNDAQFAVYSFKKPGLLTALCCILEKHKLEVVSAHISSDVDRCVYMIQARVANGACDQFPELINVEEIYKQAAVEMTLWVTA